MPKFSEDELRWVEQRRLAATVLEEMRRAELRTMTDAEAREILRRLMSHPPAIREERQYSGLVEQQRLFHPKK